MTGHSIGLLIQVCEDNFPASQLQPVRKGFYPTLASSPGKVPGISGCIRRSPVKPYLDAQEAPTADSTFNS